VHHIGGAAPIRNGMGAPYGCKVPGGVHLRGYSHKGGHRELDHDGCTVWVQGAWRRAPKGAG
jgi:hypothetical protein